MKIVNRLIEDILILATGAILGLILCLAYF